MKRVILSSDHLNDAEYIKYVAVNSEGTISKLDERYYVPEFKGYFIDNLVYVNHTTKTIQGNSKTHADLINALCKVSSIPNDVQFICGEVITEPSSGSARKLKCFEHTPDDLLTSAQCKWISKRYDIEDL